MIDWKCSEKDGIPTGVSLLVKNEYSTYDKNYKEEINYEYVICIFNRPYDIEPTKYNEKFYRYYILNTVERCFNKKISEEHEVDGDFKYIELPKK
jgi:hypothetical protein